MYLVTVLFDGTYTLSFSTSFSSSQFLPICNLYPHRDNCDSFMFFSAIHILCYYFPCDIFPSVLSTSRSILYFSSTLRCHLFPFPLSFHYLFLSIFYPNIVPLRRAFFLVLRAPANADRIEVSDEDLKLSMIRSEMGSPTAKSKCSHSRLPTTATRRCRWASSRLRIRHFHCEIFSAAT